MFGLEEKENEDVVTRDNEVMEEFDLKPIVAESRIRKPESKRPVKITFFSKNSLPNPRSS